MMQPDNDTSEQTEPTQPEQQQMEQNMPERKQPEQEATEQEAQEQTHLMRQRAEAVAAPRRAVTPSATLPVTQAEASTPPDICARLQPDLKAYQDGQVGWWRRREIGRHLARCAMCREEMEAMREFSDKWRGADADVLDPNLRARILAAVPDARPTAPAVTPSRRRPLSLALAGAGFCAIIGGIALYPLLSRTDGATKGDATRTLSAPSAVAVDAGQAQKRSESYAAAGAATNGHAASTPFAPGNGPASAASATPASAANPAGTQIADARQSASEPGDSAFGGSDRTTRNRDASGSAASGQAQPSGPKEDYNKSTDTAMGATSPPPPAAAREAAADNAPVIAGAATSSQTTSHTMSKASAPSSAPSPAPSDKTANAAGTEAASRPRRTDPSQAAGSFAQARPDPEKQPNASNKVVLPARINEEPRTPGVALSRSAASKAANKAANKEGEAAKAAASAMPSPERPIVTERAGRQDTDADTPAVVLKIRVAQAETAAATIERHVRALGGTVVTSETMTDVGGAKSATLRLKAPAVSLDTFLSQAAQTGTVLSKTVPAVRSEAADAVTKGHVRAFAGRNGNRAQTTYVNVTVVLQSQ